eukprot:1147544-Pelagomonas_calceolata.AAC.4
MQQQLARHTQGCSKPCLKGAAPTPCISRPTATFSRTAVTSLAPSSVSTRGARPVVAAAAEPAAQQPAAATSTPPSTSDAAAAPKQQKVGAYTLGCEVGVVVSCCLVACTSGTPELRRKKCDASLPPLIISLPVSACPQAAIPLLNS